jgi:hypothetical protein
MDKVQLIARIKSVSPDVTLRIKKRSSEEASIRVYALAEQVGAIKGATEGITLGALAEGMDVQVFVYDITTSLPPDQD